ncbi:preprotein translocase subunit YajC [Oceanibacterium hippocampi]|uniref:Sec translocon accessory complex subunit YajC n=1 Tax=Oceanibacterium hippocampi TaxID=745714 RepID=A0A1Y5T5S8_9PROT|nr:preprotein translocase subunit YajC [Oceanibacterium hippocampi]SLN55926.1 preprotein translocase subunit YajC [Oceanibacterium hippocampi]
MLISPAYAQAAGGAGGFDIVSILPLILIFVVFYFLLIRPQQKRAKEHKAMIEAVRRGDTIVTGGGMIGKVIRVKEDGVVQVELAEGVRVNIVRGTIAEVRSRGEAGPDEPAKPAASGDGEKKGGMLSRLKK